MRTKRSASSLTPASLSSPASVSQCAKQLTSAGGLHTGSSSAQRASSTMDRIAVKGLSPFSRSNTPPMPRSGTDGAPSEGRSTNAKYARAIASSYVKFMSYGPKSYQESNSA